MKVSELHEVEGLSATQRQAEAAFAESLAGHTAKLAELGAQRAALCDNAKTISAEELRSRADAVEDLELSLSQDACDLNAKRLELLRTRLPELNAYASAKDADRDKAYDASAKKLNANGISVATVRQHPNGAPIADANVGAAEIVFSHRVRECSGWQAANSATEKAKETAESCAAEIRSAELTVAKSEKTLAALVASLVGLPVPQPQPGNLPRIQFADAA